MSSFPCSTSEVEAALFLLLTASGNPQGDRQHTRYRNKGEVSLDPIFFLGHVCSSTQYASRASYCVLHIQIACPILSPPTHHIPYRVKLLRSPGRKFLTDNVAMSICCMRFLRVDHIIADMQKDVLAQIALVIYFDKRSLHGLLFSIALGVLEEVLPKTQELPFLVIGSEP